MGEGLLDATAARKNAAAAPCYDAAVPDYVLEITFDNADDTLGEVIESRLFLTNSAGQSSVDRDGTSVITAYFASPGERNAAAESLAGLAIELRLDDRDPIDWLDHYEQSLEPILIGDRFIVAPHARLIPEHSQRMSLVVPQEQAFGTGSHETTALCIELLETLDLGGALCLDIGAGSGILAMAMVLLGARKAIAFDNDPDAFAALRENRQRNGVEADRMPLLIASIEALRGGRFDVMTMNIIPEVILPLLSLVVERAGGSLILSGILLIRRGDVVAACQDRGFELAGERERGEWWAGLFRRPPAVD